MFPKYHILFGAIFSFFLFWIFQEITLLGAIIIFLSSVLIDVDHYLYYVFAKKNWNLFKAHRWFCERHSYMMKLSREERNKHQGVFMFLHGIEILILLAILGYFFSEIFYYILIGFVFHLFLDYIYERICHDRWEKVSVIHDYFKFKKYEKTWD